MKRLHRTFLFAVILFLAACASPEPIPAPKAEPAAEASIEAKQVAAEIGTSRVTEVEFAKGATELAAKENEKIERAVAEARAKGEIERAVVIVWSDREMARRDQRLPKADVELADRRGESLARSFEARRPEIDAEVVNMAKRVGKAREFLKTEDARIQKSLRVAGVPAEGAANRTALPKASRAIVVLEMKTKK